MASIEQLTDTNTVNYLVRGFENLPEDATNIYVKTTNSWRADPVCDDKEHYLEYPSALSWFSEAHKAKLSESDKRHYEFCCFTKLKKPNIGYTSR